MADTNEQRQLKAQEEAETAVKEHDEETERRLKADDFVVVAPFVTLKMKDANGGPLVVRGFNEGAEVKGEDVDAANLRHHVDTRLVAPKGSDDAKFAGPAGTPKPGEPPNVPVEEGTPVEMLPTQERLRRQQAAAAESEKAAAAKPRPGTKA